jgi:hypothetical protein
MTEDNKDTALEGAYAEKPFRDAEIEYRNQLSPEAQDAFKRIAGEEGEKAMKAFEERRSLEDPRISALRELAAQSIVIGWENKHSIQETSNEAKAEAVENLVKRLGQGMVDRIIANDELDFREKTGRIQELGGALCIGLGIASTNIQPEKIVTEYCTKPFGKGGWDKENTADILRGYFARKIITGHPGQAIKALAEIGKLENRNPAEVIQEHMPIILELKGQFPEMNKFEGVSIGNRPVLPLDYGMEQQDFLWSPGMGSYVYIGEPATTASK